MKTRTWLMISLVLNAGLLAGLAFLSQKSSQEIEPLMVEADEIDRVIIEPGQTSSGIRFGPAYEVVLPSKRVGERPELFDLERGKRLIEPEFEVFNNQAAAARKWIASTGLDICGRACKDEQPCCISYYMAVVPCSKTLWTSATAEDVIRSEELARITNPTRTCLYPMQNTSCFMFRTQEGGHGLLMVEQTEGVLRIRYKFAINAVPVPQTESPA